MRTKLTFFIGILVAVALAMYSITYTVRFDETAVVTRFEKPGEPISEAGLGWKWPWPVSKVYRYPKKVQVLEPAQQQYQTADNKNLVASLYITWRIEDAGAFFTSLKDIDSARGRLTELSDNLYAKLSEYAFDDLVNPDPEAIRLDAFEQAATETLRNSVSAQNYGIAIEKVGVRRLTLPEAVTENVFASMRASRESLAAKAENEGAARATQITSEAESIRDRILAFANSTANAIRAEGQEEVVAQYGSFKEEPDLAIFLSKLDAVEKILSQGRATLILDEEGTLNFMNPTAPPAPAGQ